MVTNVAGLQIYYVKPSDAQPKAVKFIENLSVANGDHVVNGIDFAHNGNLLVAVGSQTNAGIPGALGLLPVCRLLHLACHATHLDAAVGLDVKSE